MPDRAPDHTRPLVEVHDLHVRFVTREATVHAVNGVSFTARRGEVLCILGESGSGKTVTLRTLLRLLPARRTCIEGQVLVDGQDVLAADGRRPGAAAFSVLANVQPGPKLEVMCPGTEFAPDSPQEGAGFEPSVPLKVHTSRNCLLSSP
jgi:ABC-type dipeptide/oligopeptide/nickel transport system ATPase component